jgi:putative hydrolase of the HAD superfamily
MPITIPRKFVVFDYGEVISPVPATADRAELLVLADADPIEFWAVYWRHRIALDQGTVTTREYWQLIERDLGKSWDTAKHHRLWLMDFRSWLVIEQGTLDILIDLQLGGTRMALLSNAGLDFSSYYRHGMLGDFFEQVLVSGELGRLKPEPEIYLELIDSLGVPPEDIIFIDNRSENIDGAEALGIRGHVYTGPVELRRFLQDAANEAILGATAAPPTDL